MFTLHLYIIYTKKMNKNTSLKIITIMSLFMAINSKPIINCNLESNSNNVTCGTCKFLVNIIDHEIQVGNKTIGIITHDIKEICSMIQGPSAKECEMVVTDIQEIVNWITSGFNSTEICYKLHLCPEILEEFYNIIMINLFKNKIDLKPIFNKTFTNHTDDCFSKYSDLYQTFDYCCPINSTKTFNDINKIYICNTMSWINLYKYI